MLKMIEVYNVVVTLNDGREMCCTLLSKPDSMTLAAVAKTFGEGSTFGKVLALADDVAVPVLGAGELATAISVADVIVGTIVVTTIPAYGLPVKRGRKPKVAEVVA